jgi:hypothetical protein
MPLIGVGVVPMSMSRGSDPVALRGLIYVMVGMLALALLFFLAPYVGIGLMLLGLLAIPVAWLIWRRQAGASDF